MDALTIKKMDVKLALDGIITCVIGPSNAGKTYLLKKLCNKVNNDDVFIDDVSINEYDITFLKNNICMVLNDDLYYSEYVFEELVYHLTELSYRMDEAIDKAENIAKYFKITDLMHDRLDNIVLSKRILVKILSYLIINPKILGIDNLLSYLTNDDKELLIKFIRDENINLINVTSNTEDLLFSDDVIVMNEGKCVLSGNYRAVFDGNSILPYMGLNLPFVVELSQNLILYNMIDEVYVDNRKLVDSIWK